MKVLVVGSGGREHTMVWKLSESESVSKIYAAPGNAGIAALAECIPVASDDIDGIIKFAFSRDIGLVAVGPEVPLCRGIVNRLSEAGIAAFGPSAQAAMIEGSKVFSKQFMNKYKIPTASFETFDDFGKAVSFARALDAPLWVKASGLAAGKGAVFALDAGIAERILRGMMLEGEFGESGKSVVIEENLAGEEASIFALCDGTSYRLMVPSQDHKRACDGDTGPNTGGMGAYAPAPLITPALMDSIEKLVIQPTIEGMAAENRPYRGVLYAGVIITGDGPKVIEYNCRFGDPETQAVLPLLAGDLGEIMLSCTNGTLARAHLQTSPQTALCVVIASGGYPGSYEKGKVIHGLGEAACIEGVHIFHAGTKQSNGNILSAGGRVLGVTGIGADLIQARKRAYASAELIHFENSFYRTDIGAKANKYFNTGA